MIGAVVKFEILFLLRKPVTYISFLLLLAVCMLSGILQLNVVESSNGVWDNAPVTLTYTMIVISVFFMTITSWIIGTTILRDYQFRIDSIFHSTSLSKSNLLTGRFIGGMIILLLVFMAMPLGHMIADLLPFNDPSRTGPFNIYTYFNIFWIFIVPNLFFTASLFFMVGTLSRKVIWVLTQGVLLLVLYLFTLQVSTSMGNENLAALLDPFGIVTFQVYSRYWTVADQNVLQLPLDGVILYNRVIWILSGLIIIAITFYRFHYPVKEREKFASHNVLPSKLGITRSIVLMFSGSRLASESIFYFLFLLREKSFRAIMVTGLLVLTYAIFSQTGPYGVSLYPTTYIIMQIIDGFDIFIIALVIFFAAELTWKERDIRLNEITDSYSGSQVTSALGKLIAIALLCVFILTLLLITGIFVQLIHGYFDIDLKQYFIALFWSKLVLILSSAVLAMSIQILARNKYVGYGIISLVMLTLNVLPYYGVERDIFRFGEIPLGIYSDLNGFLGFSIETIAYTVLWIAFGFLLLTSAISIKNRIISKSIILIQGIAFTFFLSSVAFVYYNTDVLNDYKSDNKLIMERVAYEQQLKPYRQKPQPKITRTDIALDIFPSTGSFSAIGKYRLRNTTGVAIDEVFVQAAMDTESQTIIDFDRPSQKVYEYPQHGVQIFKINPTLLPGDSLVMDFQSTYTNKGFKNGPEEASVVSNGTLLHSAYFPRLGYQIRNELTVDRELFGLDTQEISYDAGDSIVRSTNMYSNDSDYIDLNIVVSTEKEQTAIAPGSVISQWIDNNRSFFQYKSDYPIINFYAIASACYQKVMDTVRIGNMTIELEIYHHKGHERNLANIMNAMKASLSYCVKMFGTYPYRQLRLVEVTRYNLPAQSLPGTIYYSETGFVTNINEDELDVVYGTIAHETSHQWWGHQIAPANAMGQTMLTETLAQYTALMVLKKAYNESKLKRFLKYDLNSYLIGRSNEQYYEESVSNTISRGYVHYNKGLWVMNAFQNYVGEENVNQALSRFLKEWKFKVSPYPATTDLLPFFEEVTPEKYRYIIDDLFRNITLYENKILLASSEIQKTNSDYVTTIIFNARKTYSIRNRVSEVETNEWIDIAVYDQDGSKLSVKEFLMISGDNKVSFVTPKKPAVVAIDPEHKLLDRNLDDNIMNLD